MYKLETLKNEINDLRYLIEHSSSKSLKNFYTVILLNMADLLYALTDEIEDVKISNFKFMSKYSSNLMKSIIEQITDKDYMNFINTLTNNSKKYLKIDDQRYYFNSNITVSKAKSLIKDFIYQYDVSLYPIIEKALSEQHLFFINDKNKNGDGFSYFNYHSGSPYTVIYI